MRIIRTMRFIPSTDKYQSWKEFKGDNYDYCLPLHYIKNEFNYKEILLFLPILFPNFIVKDGFIFLEFLYSDEKFNKIPKGLKLNEVVEAINHLCLKDLFRRYQNLNMLNELADILAVSWYLSLKEKFPNKEFTIRLSKGEGASPIVTCSQFPNWCKEFYSGVREGSDGVKMMPTLPFIPKMAEEMGDTHHARLLLDDISNACALEGILLFSPILFPTFIVREGAVFLQFLYSEEKFNKLRQEMSLHHLEEAMNHLSLKDFFRGCQNLSGKLFNEMAEMLAFSWRLSLKEKFPNKEFTVCVSKGEDSSPMISFSQSEGANYENEFTPYDADYWNGKWRRDKEISCSWQKA